MRCGCSGPNVDRRQAQLSRFAAWGAGCLNGAASGIAARWTAPSRGARRRCAPLRAIWSHCLSLASWLLRLARETLPDALLFVLSVLFRKIFVLQLVGLVLTSNFTDCDFEKIRMDYLNIISKDLTCTDCDATLSCEDQPDCLTKIERLTLHPTPRCKSLPKELARRTEAALERSCPGYYRKQKNNAQAMKKRKKREATINECQKIVSNLIGLWRRFLRL
ncbi:thymic stromal lymphopoietin [Myotis lucifugus]|uniref:thymic stromal lymphopoietin n=1 Tax=Myotis lucifugus TaxID=59463 RepID=UPI000CCC88E0|nr:thymic stromal lymphopoietin [Myotis lucifugus]